MINKKEAIAKIKNCGLIGAGGAGFPTYVKLNASVDTVIINSAECEPLLYKDKELIRLFPEQIVKGLLLAMQITGASNGIIGLKAKNKEAIHKLKTILKQEQYKNISIGLLEDVYPAGDEVITIYELTGKIVPPGKIPLEVGVVVSNTETFYNLYNAIEKNLPVTDSYITIAGDIEKPFSIKTPVGTLLKDILPFAEKIFPEKPAFISGGPMMGSVTFDKNDPITKTCSGYIVLSSEHPLIKKKTNSEHSWKRIGKSTCDQCSYCTEFCPRYLLGHNIRPHMVMRTLGLSGPQYQNTSSWAIDCVNCKLCSYFACPEMLSPGDICTYTKQELAKNKTQITRINKELKPHPMREFRKLPTKKLLIRLGLGKFDKSAHILKTDFIPTKVFIPFSQHIGVPCKPIVTINQKVEKGQIIGNTDEKDLGVPIHASISGKITEISKIGITIERV